MILCSVFVVFLALGPEGLRGRSHDYRGGPLFFRPPVPTKGQRVEDT